MAEDKVPVRRRRLGARHDVPAKAVFHSGAEPVGSPDFMEEANAPEATPWAEGRFGFFLLQTAVTH